MTVKRRRTYHSPQRDEQANATRARILSAAGTLFAERGFAAVTMDAIAREAEVSLATVYIYFPGKAAVVTGMADDITNASDLSVEQVERAADPIEQLRIGAGIIRRLNERAWLITDVLRSAHGRDSTLAEAWDGWQRRHLTANQRAAAALAAAGALRPGLSPGQAADTLYALTGPEIYRALVRERGWSADAYERWLFRTGCAELLGIAPGDVEPGVSGSEMADG
jgi:AcrR family transcriptional regulator